MNTIKIVFLPVILLFAELSIAVLPHDIYVRKNIDQQSQAYRKIYDRLYREIKASDPHITQANLLTAMGNRPASDLLEIFKDGVLIVRDLFSKNTQHSQFDRKRYFERLDNLWIKAQENAKNSLLSAKTFIDLNINLARLTSEFKNEPFSGMENIEERPVFIVYAHPDAQVKNRNIAPATFTKEYVGDGSYPAWMALFDIHSNKNVTPTKKDAHFSDVNGTARFLMHDFHHIPTIQKEADTNMYQIVTKTYDLIKKANKNDASVIASGLFQLFHEGQSRDIFILPKAEANLKLSDRLRAIVRKFRSSLIFAAPQSSLLAGYKVNTRDFEFILKEKDENNEPFLSTIEIAQGKYRALPVAMSQVGKKNTYHIIKDLKDFQPGMTWIEKNEDVPIRVYNERASLLGEAKVKAYKHFWDRFEKLTENI